ncbi:MAG: 30S ribosomal protein S1, partial [Gordonia sp. (in: high G+C Gram-positive bacteria)]
EWLEGFDEQQKAWEGRYAEAERRHKMHTAQMEKFAKAAAEAENAPSDYSSSTDEGKGAAASSAGGSLASDEQLAALREKLAGNA